MLSLSKRVLCGIPKLLSPALFFILTLLSWHIIVYPYFLGSLHSCIEGLQRLYNNRLCFLRIRQPLFKNPLMLL